MLSRLLIASLFVFVWACSKTESVVPYDVNWQPKTIDGQFVFNTFTSAGLGGSRGRTQKWETSKVYYWYDVESTPTKTIIDMADSVFTQINALSQSTQFLKTTNQSQANIIIYSGRSADFEAKYNLNLGIELTIGGTAFTGYSSTNEISKVTIWVSSILPQLERRLVTRHEIGHSIGFSHVPTKRSIMWDTIDIEYNPTDYTDVDKSYIKILYDRRTHANMTQQDLIPIYMDYLQ